MTTFKQKIAKARLPQRTVALCLNADLVAEHEQAERELQQAQQSATDSLAGDGASSIAERIQALEAEMHEATETFTLRALPFRRGPKDDRPSYQELEKAHPPRRGDDGEIVEDDRGAELNVETFYVALVRACVVGPQMDDEDWDTLLSTLSTGQFAELSATAMVLNRNGIKVPFSRAASRMRRLTDDE